MVQLKGILSSFFGKASSVLGKIVLGHNTPLISGSRAMLSRGALVEGDPSDLDLGVGTVVECGAVLSTTYGGRIVLGSNCLVRRGAMIMTYGGDIELGDNCVVGPYAILYGHGGLRAGHHVLFAAHSIVIPADHTFEVLDATIHDQPLRRQGICIEDDVWIGAGARILDGTLIGRGSVIGAGSVVTRSIEPFSVNAGVPARMIRMRTDSEEA